MHKAQNGCDDKLSHIHTHTHIRTKEYFDGIMTTMMMINIIMIVSTWRINAVERVGVDAVRAFE